MRNFTRNYYASLDRVHLRPLTTKGNRRGIQATWSWLYAGLGGIGFDSEGEDHQHAGWLNCLSQLHVQARWQS